MISIIVSWSCQQTRRERAELPPVVVVDPGFHEEVDLLLYNRGCVENRTQGLIPSEALGASITCDNHDWPTAATPHQQNANQSLRLLRDKDLRTGGPWRCVEKEDNKQQFLRRSCSHRDILPDYSSLCKSFFFFFSLFFFFFLSEIVSDCPLKVSLTGQTEFNMGQNWLWSGARGLSSLPSVLQLSPLSQGSQSVWLVILDLT